MLDERLTLAASLYVPCAVGADIGTDHGFLPCRLLLSNVCQRMILSDVSPKALAHARAAVAHWRLESRASLVCADGLDALTEPCGCVSIMGMGGETVAAILRRGPERLQGAALILSAHTDLPLVRGAVAEIGYHLTREELCRAAGRFYLVWRAEPGAEPVTDAALRRGALLWRSGSPLLGEYAAWRAAVLTDKLRGLRSAAQPDRRALTQVEEELAFYQEQMEVHRSC